jgi:hypothetical protein
MFDRVYAVRYDRKMNTGKTKPCLMACIKEDSTEVEAVVKFSSGCERGVGGLVTEAVAAMFAADLELPVPEPFLVEVDPQLIELITDAEVRLAASQSSAAAFGSKLLPPSHSVWIHTRQIPTELQQQALEIFAFDSLLSNGDRRPGNPNCLSNGKGFAIFDHELCFVPPLWGPRPWEPNGLEFMKAAQAMHLFQQQLHGVALNLDRFAGAVEAVTPERIAEYLSALPPDWADDGGAADAAREQLLNLRSNIEAAITEVIRVLS